MGLGLGAIAGLLLAAAGALMPTPGGFSGGVLARVNGKAITVSDVEFALERLDDNSPVTREKQLEVLHRLIDQELLIQRASELGLLDSDRTVRKAVAMAVITMPARLRLQQIYCGGDGDFTKALTKVEQAAAAIARGISFAEARKQYDDNNSTPLPDTPLPRHVLQRYLGPTLTETALTMKVGEISPPLPSPVGYHILRVVDRQPEQLRPYESIRQEVRA